MLNLKILKLTSTLLTIVSCFTLFSCQDDTKPGNDKEEHEYTPADDFVTTWKTDNPGVSNSTSIRIPSSNNYDYNYDVDWNNDGVFDELGITGSVTHDFEEAGTYTIRIRGEFPAIIFPASFEPDGDSEKLLSVDQWGFQVWKRLRFLGCTNFNITATDQPNLTQVTDMSNTFYGCVVFNSDIGDWDVSNVTDMWGMFQYTYAFNQDISNWDVSQVEYMHNMFYYAQVFNQDIGNWNVSGATDMGYMFYHAESFNQNIGNWNVSGVNDMTYMFAFASSFNKNIGGWNVNQVTDMNSMFWYAEAFNQNLGNWDVSNVVDMWGMFYSSAFNQDISDWDVSQVKYMGKFLYASDFNTINYDKLLIAWADKALQNDVILDVSALYCSNEAELAKQKITNTFTWTIYDDGRDSNCN